MSLLDSHLMDRFDFLSVSLPLAYPFGTASNGVLLPTASRWCPVFVTPFAKYENYFVSSTCFSFFLLGSFLTSLLVSLLFAFRIRLLAACPPALM